MMRRLSIVTMAALLSGCGARGSDCVIRLPAYTVAEQTEAARGLPGALAIHRRMIEDYGQMRAEWRAACRR